MEYLISVIIGYLLGSVSPAALIGKIKKINLRKNGTGNLGATNTTLVFGKKFGIAVMIFDIAKSSVSVIIARLLFPQISLLAGLCAGSAAVVGHMFPFYMKFRGGKGLAAYGGMVLAFDPLLFLILLCIGLAAMLIFNCGVALTLSASLLFPILVAFKFKFLPLSLLATAISILLILRHVGNIVRAFRGQDITVRQFFKRIFGNKKQDR